MKIMNKTERNNFIKKITKLDKTLLIHEDIPKQLKIRTIENRLCFYMNISKDILVNIFYVGNFEISIDGESWSFKKMTVNSWNEVIKILEELTNFNSELYITTFVNKELTLNSYHPFIEISDELNDLLHHSMQRTIKVIVGMINLILEENATEDDVNESFIKVINQLNTMLKKG